MVGAVWVKWSFAKWTIVATIFIFPDRHFTITIATENGLCIQFCCLPDFSSMTGLFLVTEITGIVGFATFKFDGNNIQFGMIVYTTGMRIHCFTLHYLLASRFFQIQYLFKKIQDDSHCGRIINEVPGWSGSAYNARKVSLLYYCF